MRLILFYIFILIQTLIIGQNKNLNLGYKDSGLILGNSKCSNGLRLNIWDKNVDTINGFNISAFSATRKSNGLSFGFIANTDSINNGIKIGGFVSTAEKVSGISVSGLINGIDGKINGLAVSGLYSYADTMNGIFISFFGSLNFTRDPINIINGISVGMFVHAEKFNGLSIGFMNSVDTLNGINFGFVHNQSKKVNGIQIGMSNETDNLHGVQFGLWNIARNNRFLRQTPFINFNFRKKASR